MFLFLIVLLFGRATKLAASRARLHEHFSAWRDNKDNNKDNNEDNNKDFSLLTGLRCFAGHLWAGHNSHGDLL